MKIAISGSTGFIGKKLTDRFKELKWTVIPLKRIDFELGTDWLSQKITGSDVIINLAGAPVAKRWSKSYKKTLYKSRIHTTKILVEAINKSEKKPDLFISTSAVGIYDSIHNHDESSSFLAENFLGDLCKDWEKECYYAKCNIAIFRLSVVLDSNYGAFPKMIFPFTLGLGGKIGNGKQHFSWIHIEDLLNAFIFVINSKKKSEIYNLASPNPITNKIFTDSLSSKLKKAAFLSIPLFVFKIMYGKASIIFTEGQYVIPKNLLAEKFVFRYPDFQSAMENLI